MKDITTKDLDEFLAVLAIYVPRQQLTQMLGDMKRSRVSQREAAIKAVLERLVARDIERRSSN